MKRGAVALAFGLLACRGERAAPAVDPSAARDAAVAAPLDGPVIDATSIDAAPAPSGKRADGPGRPLQPASLPDGALDRGADYARAFEESAAEESAAAQVDAGLPGPRVDAAVGLRTAP